MYYDYPDNINPANRMALNHILLNSTKWLQ